MNLNAIHGFQVLRTIYQREQIQEIFAAVEKQKKIGFHCPKGDKVLIASAH